MQLKVYFKSFPFYSLSIPCLSLSFLCSLHRRSLAYFPFTIDHLSPSLFILIPSQLTPSCPYPIDPFAAALSPTFSAC